MIIIPKWGTWGEINAIMALLQISDLLNKHLHTSGKHWYVSNTEDRTSALWLLNST